MTEAILEGTVYKVITIDNTVFEIRYGYDSPEEKKRGWEPTPLYPDFTEHPQYDSEGCPFATVYQEVCRHYRPRETVPKEKWCENCQYFEKHEQYIGICRCEKMRHHDAVNERRSL